MADGKTLTMRAEPDGRLAVANLTSHWRPVMFIGVLVLGAVGRITYGWQAPFWFDETFSAVIASQPSFRALLAWCLNEVTGPAYYMPLWLWEKVVGPGDQALRAPSLFFSLLAPLVLYWRGHPDRDVRLFWAVIVLLWLPAMTVATDARPYPQLFFLGAVQAVFFQRVMTGPTRRRALGWATATALMILTNYNALVISGIQGVLCLVRYRRALWSLWPALSPLLVAAGWMAAHLSFMLSYASVHDAVYVALPLSQLSILPALLFGISLHGTIILGTIAVTQGLAMRRSGIVRLASFSPDQLLALSGVLAFALVFGLAFVRAGFAPRYLTPVMPALLFAVALWAREQSRRNAVPVVIVLAVMAVMTAGLIRSNLVDVDTDGRHLFNLERPSAWLGEARPTRMVFFWDGPIGRLGSSERLAEVAGFFFHRAGHPLAVDVVRTRSGEDPNRTVIAAAGHAPGTVILWMANDTLSGARAPHVSRLDTRWECRDFGGGQSTVTACR
jgi:hypothetical protein